jgi:hypothetical protein
MAEQIGALFRAARRKAGYEEDFNLYALSTASFRKPHRHGQLGLFEE